NSQCINEVDFNPDCCEKFKTTYRLKNECEKGNPDWVEITSCHKDGNKIELYDKNGVYQYTRWTCIPKTICREKTPSKKLGNFDCTSDLAECYRWAMG
ncbi:MAG: hypothetical protein AABY22_28760, partial [Nanoarchaeota archaeon]